VLQPEPKLTKIAQITKNAFHDLYFSEEEEGEIVEDRIINRPKRPEPEPEPEVKEDSWTRSGLRAFKIASSTEKHSDSEEEDDEKYHFNEETRRRVFEFLDEYLAPLRGMSWADFE
jgi:hypothetical protein